MGTVKRKGNGGDQRTAADDLHHEIQNKRDQRGFQNRMPAQKREKAGFDRLFTRIPIPVIDPMIQAEHFLSA